MTALPLCHGLAGLALIACFAAIPAGLEAQPEFGDDTSQWANDDECDDPRFEGEGAAATLLAADLGHDAADCRKLFAAGRIALRGTGVIDFGDDGSEWARDGECDDPRFEGEGMATTLLDADAYHDATDCRTLLERGRVALPGGAGADLRRGRLEKGDETLTSGEYADEYSFSGSVGERAVVDLRSADFDPYLFVRAPSGEQFDNDDFVGDASRSLLSLDLAERGEYRVTVTSYSKGETGGYTLSMDVGRSAGLAARIERNGRLESGDGSLASGEYFDSYEFEGTPGQRVALDLRSSAFDTYLIVRDPAGEQTENDDADDGSSVGHSNIELDLTEAGTYHVLVTSYETGESGPYSLTIDPTARQPASPATRDVTTLTVGVPIGGDLDADDATFEAGEYHETYVFDGDAGDTVRLELSSADFDTYLSSSRRPARRSPTTTSKAIRIDPSSS